MFLNFYQDCKTKLSFLVFPLKLCFISRFWLSHETRTAEWVSAFPSLVLAATRPPISQPIFDVCQMCSNRRTGAGCNDRLWKSNFIAHQQANNKPHLPLTLQLCSLSESGVSLRVLALTIYGNKLYWGLIGCGGEKAQVDALPCLGLDSDSFFGFLLSQKTKNKTVACFYMKTTQQRLSPQQRSTLQLHARTDTHAATFFCN